jgi:hypothetical protein
VAPSSSAGQPRAHDRGEPDAAGSKDDDDTARLDAGAVDDGPVPRHHSAADERGHLERSILADDDAAALRNDAAFGEGRKVGVVVERPAVFREPQSSPGQGAPEHVRHRQVAEGLAPARAVKTAPAGREPGKDDVIALGNSLDTLAHGHDHTGAFVAEHRRERIRGCARDDVPIAVADTGR